MVKKQTVNMDRFGFGETIFFPSITSTLGCIVVVTVSKTSWGEKLHEIPSANPLLIYFINFSIYFNSSTVLLQMFCDTEILSVSYIFR